MDIKYKSINIILPNSTIELINRAIKKGTRDSFINKVLLFYIKSKKLSNLKKQLREGAIRRSNRDLEITEEWSLIR